MAFIRGHPWCCPCRGLLLSEQGGLHVANERSLSFRSLAGRSLSRLPSLGKDRKHSGLPIPHSLSLPSVIRGITHDQGCGCNRAGDGAWHEWSQGCPCEVALGACACSHQVSFCPLRLKLSGAAGFLYLCELQGAFDDVTL